MIDKTCALLGLPPFAVKVVSKLRRFEECASDGEGADIGREWFDILTQLGLLKRVQRSPGLWEMTKEGEDLLCAPVPSAGGEVLRYSESCDGIDADENGDYCHYTHVTRLQADVELLHKSNEEYSGAAVQNGMECDRLLSELTNVRELLKGSYSKFKYIAEGGSFYQSTAAEGMRLIHKAYQSAPAAKGGSHTACGYDCSACATGKAKP